MTNLLGLDRTQLQSWLVEQGEQKFRAQQLMQWIHQRFVCDFDAMLDLSKVFRAKLKEIATIEGVTPSKESRSVDGTRKWLFPVGESYIEAVLIPEPARNTLCISSQVGCMLDCSFCATGKQGFDRNLTAAEIVGQLWYVQKTLAAEGEPPVTNVVFMGMGEPMLNMEAVWPAFHIMLDDYAYGLSAKRVTVSTSGVIPGIEALESEDVALALSLHAPNDALRDELVPINKKYPLAELIPACQRYVAADPRRSVTIEYVMLHKVNDSLQHAKQLIRLLANLHVKINLIPYNPFPGVQYTCSTEEDIHYFQEALRNAGFIVTIRRSRGRDIKAACGQLAGDVQDKTKRQARWRLKVTDGSQPAV